MKLQSILLSAVMSVGGVAAIGCDDGTTTTTETKTTRTDAQTTGDATADNARNAADRVADGMRDAGHNIADAARAARAARDEAATTRPADVTGATAADAGVVATVTDLYNKATAAINAKRLDEAQGYVNQLKTYRDKVPADWQTKIDQLVSTFDSAKAQLNALPNVNINR